MLLSVAVAKTAAKKLDPLDLMLGSSGVVLVVLILLIAASTAVWVIWALKWMQLRRLSEAHRAFEQEATRSGTSRDLLLLVHSHPTAPGSGILRALEARLGDFALTQEFLSAVSKRAVANEEQSASALMPALSSIATAAPFIGLFGTVWGIMDAFLRIGVEKSASLPVVAPAIGEALIATAFGLVAAIPATIAYNFIDRRIGDLVDELHASSDVWVSQLYAGEMHDRAQRGMQQR
jgi:biopolymer transport protein TolQ